MFIRFKLKLLLYQVWFLDFKRRFFQDKNLFTKKDCYRFYLLFLNFSKVSPEKYIYIKYLKSLYAR